ncbi:hypothetical protein LEP1GSC037_3496 [Leptospira interrogans str. 2006001854]|uniref:Uncharacterized protein n=1 Tax=Leptospira interrogans str. 2006001854 TaxID=1001590 RepID=M6G269_LEPIR|nr:hypothetical protein LEP1GSC037_3496 [Leptospira interrogans str. 2006001854]
MAQIKNTIFKTTSKRTNHGFILIVGILILFLLDFSFFRVLIWKVPNESPWSSNHFYNFLYEYFSLQEKQKKIIES